VLIDSFLLKEQASFAGFDDILTISPHAASLHTRNIFALPMANTKSAAKRARQSIARSRHNRSVRTRLRTLQKRARAAAKPAAQEIHALISAIDKAAKRGIIHRNAANHRKARLNKMIGATAAQK